MTASVKLGKHFMALTDKYAKKVVITKSDYSSNRLTLSFIPQSPDLQHQLNYIRNSGQVCSVDWRGIEKGRLIMEAVGVLPVDELIAVIKADMEELGYEVEVLPKPEEVKYKGQGLGLMAWDVTPEELVELQEQQPLVYPPAPETQEELDKLLNIQPLDNIHDIGKP